MKVPLKCKFFLINKGIIGIFGKARGCQGLLNAFCKLFFVILTGSVHGYNGCFWLVYNEIKPYGVSSPF